MLKRTLVGATVLGVGLGAWWLDAQRPGEPAWAVGTLGLILTLGALWEALTIGGHRDGVRAAVTLLGVVWIGLVCLPALRGTAQVDSTLDVIASLPLAPVLVLASILANVALLARLRRGPSEDVATLAQSPLFALAWAGGLSCLLMALVAGRIEFVLGTVLTAKSSDIGAYFSGKFLGRHKLVPKISPNKTVEGAVGGMLAPAAVGAFLMAGVDVTLPVHDGLTVALPSSPLAGAAYGAVLGVVVILSDLCESLVKRALDVKDSGSLFGESGGFLDLADSLLLVAPVSLAYIAFLA